MMGAASGSVEAEVNKEPPSNAWVRPPSIGDFAVSQEPCSQEDAWLIGVSSTARFTSPTEPDPGDDDSGSHINAFELGKTLSKRSLCDVKFASHIETGRVCVLKMYGKVAVTEQNREQMVMRERSVLRAAHHPFIVKMFACFQDRRRVYFAIEYVPGGELFCPLRREGRFSNERARFYSAQIASALGHLHGLGIIYRNLKPEEILIDAEGYVKLVDFGFARDLADGEIAYTLCGTAEYLAPEVLLNRGHGKPADWWSFGILVYEMMVGNPPFGGANAIEVYQSILKGKVSFPAEVGDDVRHLLKGILVADDTKRKNSFDLVAAEAWYTKMQWKRLLGKKLHVEWIKSTSGDNSGIERLDADTDAGMDLPPELAPSRDPFIAELPDFCCEGLLRS